MRVYPKLAPESVKRIPITHVTVPDVTIAIPTFRRTEALLHVLTTTRERLNSRYRVSILVIDNNPIPQEQTRVDDFAATTDFPVGYIHEPHSGVSNARNAAFAYAETRFIAFLDDDMEITSAWLDSLIETSLETGFGVIFGPIVAKFADVTNPHNPYLSPFYSRTVDAPPSCELKKPFGTGGCLIDLDQGQHPNPPFDPDLNEFGGEDDIFFSALKRSGVQFGWAKQALCFENVPKSRTTSSYILRRNFGYGQAPTRLAATRGLSSAPQIARHMITGAVQCGVYGSLYLVASALKRPSSVRYLGLTARGFGKIFWADRFQQKLYGASQLSP